jgi:hypothetical protein
VHGLDARIAVVRARELDQELGRLVARRAARHFAAGEERNLVGEPRAQVLGQTGHLLIVEHAFGEHLLAHDPRVERLAAELGHRALRALPS